MGLLSPTINQGSVGRQPLLAMNRMMVVTLVPVLATRLTTVDGRQPR